MDHPLRLLYVWLGRDPAGISSRYWAVAFAYALQYPWHLRFSYRLGALDISASSVFGALAFYLVPHILDGSYSYECLRNPLCTAEA